MLQNRTVPLFKRWSDGAKTMTRWLVRQCDGDGTIAMKRCSIAPSSSCHHTIAISLSYHRVIVIAPSRHRSIDRVTQTRWCNAAKVNCVALFGFHSVDMQQNLSGVLAQFPRMLNMIALQMSQVDMDKCHVKITILHVDIAYLTCRGQKVCPHTLIGIPTSISYSPWQTPYHLTTFRHKHLINQSQLTLTDTLKTTMSLPEKHHQPQHSLTST